MWLELWCKEWLMKLGEASCGQLIGLFDRGNDVAVVDTIFERHLQCGMPIVSFRHGSSKLKPPDHSNRLYYDDFNEMFWETAPLSWLRSVVREGDARLSPTSVKNLIDSLSKSKVPGKSVKTFVERRSYAQVTLLINALNIFFIFRCSGRTFGCFIGTFLSSSYFFGLEVCGMTVSN